MKLIMVCSVQVSTFCCLEQVLMKTNYMMLLNYLCSYTQSFHCYGNTSIVWVMILPVAVSVDSLCPDIPGWEVTSKHPFDVIVEVINSCILFFP